MAKRKAAQMVCEKCGKKHHPRCIKCPHCGYARNAAKRNGSARRKKKVSAARTAKVAASPKRRVKRRKKVEAESPKVRTLQFVESSGGAAKAVAAIEELKGLFS
jgi:predicted ATP-dependent serine protease